MLRNQQEIEILKGAWEAGIRDPFRPQNHFASILNRFYYSTNVNGHKILDLGPGHYDFSEMIGKKGATTTSLELDPAVIELGNYRGLDVRSANLKDATIYNDLKEKYDGIFCRGSINATWWFESKTKHEQYIDCLLATLKPQGHAWISPCNSPVNCTREEYTKAVETQIAIFKERGFKILFPNKIQAYRYGIWSDMPKLIFTKNLKYINFPW